MTYLLNLTDLLFTIHALSHGAWEVNPVMRYVMSIHPWAFPFCKIVIGGIACVWLEYMSKQNHTARVGGNICAAFYGAVNLWHISNILYAWF